LNSQLNSDYSSVMGFFQNIGSWGADFKTTLTGAGTSSSTGILALELTAISTSESTMNAQISREESTISAERVQLTKELISANEVLQAIPSKLSEVNEIYSAISGYNTSS
jgi:flagellar hook-associated protein 2